MTDKWYSRRIPTGSDWFTFRDLNEGVVHWLDHDEVTNASHYIIQAGNEYAVVVSKNPHNYKSDVLVSDWTTDFRMAKTILKLTV